MTLLTIVEGFSDWVTVPVMVAAFVLGCLLMGSMREQRYGQRWPRRRRVKFKRRR